MADIRLTPTSYVVMGLLDRLGPSTPYGLKQAVALGVGNFWMFPHTQLYTEPERLAKAGMLHEEREKGGRRRKVYSLTPEGRRALDAWRAEPTSEYTELRDPGLLKVFFESDVEPIAEMQLEAHERKLAEYEALRNRETGQEPMGMRLSLRAGIGHEKEWIRFWKLAAEGKLDEI